MSYKCEFKDKGCDDFGCYKLRSKGGICKSVTELDYFSDKNKQLQSEKKKLAESKPSKFVVCIGNRGFFNFQN